MKSENDIITKICTGGGEEAQKISGFLGIKYECH